MTAPTGLLDQQSLSALRRLEWQLRGRRVHSSLVGEHRSIFRGRGMELDQVVKYAFGDDIRDVDWKVTARLGDIYRKLFVEDREITIFVVVSDAPALQFGSGRASKRDVLFDLAGLAMMLAIVNRERVALLHASPDNVRLFPPTRRRARIMAAIAELFAAPVPDPAIPQPFDFSPIFPHAIPRGALILWLGDVPATLPPSEWAAIRRHHHVIGIRVEDEWERAGPAFDGFMAYDPSARDLVWIEDTPAARAAHLAWREERERIWAAWWPIATDRLTVDSNADPLAALVGFLRKRAARNP